MLLKYMVIVINVIKYCISRQVYSEAVHRK
jgi:hypothetical protein